MNYQWHESAIEHYNPSRWVDWRTQSVEGTVLYDLDSQIDEYVADENLNGELTSTDQCVEFYSSNQVLSRTSLVRASVQYVDILI